MLVGASSLFICLGLAGWLAEEPLCKKVKWSVLFTPEIMKPAVMYDKFTAIEVSLYESNMLRTHQWKIGEPAYIQDIEIALVRVSR